MADEKITIDLGTGINEIEKEIDGLKKMFAEMGNSISKTVRAVEKGFNSLTASSRALNNALSNLFGTTETTLASFDEIDRLEEKQICGGGTTGSVVVTVEVDIGQIEHQIQETINSISGLMINVDLNVDISSVSEKVNELKLNIETSFDSLLSLDFTALIGGILGVIGVAGTLSALLFGGLSTFADDLLNLDFSVLMAGIVIVLAPAASLSTLLFNGLSTFADDLLSLDFSVLDNGILKVTEFAKVLKSILFDGLIVFMKNLLAVDFTPLINGLLNITAVAITPLTLLWDKLLKPMGEWTGGLLLGALGQMQEKLMGISQWIDENQILVEHFTKLIQMLTGSFKVVWGEIERVWGSLDALRELLEILSSPQGAISLIVTGISDIATSGGDAKDSVNDLWTIFHGVLDFILGVFTKDWDKAWEGLKEIFIGCINAGIEQLNGIIDWINSRLKINFGGLNILGVQVIPPKSYQIFTIPHIPRLATGAVIPPNREFMAVLGDQKSGMNIETPEGLLRQIFREESGNGAVVSELREILSAIREGKVMMVGKREFGAIVQEALSSTTRSGMATMPVR